MGISRNKLQQIALLMALLFSLSPGVVVAATIENALRCSSGLTQDDGQYEVGNGTLRPSETTENKHTYTFPEKEDGPFKRWPIDKYGRLAKNKFQNVYELELTPDIIFRHDTAHTVCIVLRLKHYETGEPVVNKSIKYPSIKYVQWAFIIRKDIYETGDPIVLEVLFSETMPGVLEKAKLFRLEAFVPRSGGEMELVVMEPIIALEMDE